MKHLLLLLTIVLSLKVVSAQDSLLSKAKLPRTLYYIDDYLDYRNKVGDFDHASAKAYIKNGKFFYTSKLENNAHTTWMSFNIDPAMNCYVEMEFEQTEGKETQGCGLIFNHTTTKKNAMWKFLVSKDRSFLILKKQDDKDVEICPWTKCNYLQYWGNNRIAYFMKGNQIYFYINDHLVFNCKRPTYMGSDVGFQVGSASTIAVDKFTIRYNPLAVKDIPDGRYGYKKEDLGKNINSELDESFPVVSADGKLMFFSRATNFGSIEYDKRTIMYSEKDEATGEWSMAKPLPPNINQARKPQLISVSPDKNSIVITGSFSKSGKYLNDDGVAVSYRTKSGWTDPVNIVIPGYVNLDEYDDHCLSANNKVLIMSVNRPGGFGERDLYVSLFKNGSWTVPRNMGTSINSFGDDASPCLAPDNVTLYYSSNGKPGYGKADMFVTRRLDDSWTNWSEPENLGPEINNQFGNTGLQVDAEGMYAYIDEYQDNKIKTNIYKFVLPESARPKPVVIVHGKSINALTNEPISIPIVYENMESHTEEGTALSGAEDGTFVLVLPYGVDYSVTATQNGYISESRRINLTDTSSRVFKHAEVELYVMPLAKGGSICLNNIFFAPDKFDLNETSFNELDRIVKVMNQQPSLTIEIAGHTDKGGAEASVDDLILLSQNRANAVRQYLISKGITESRINAVGYGNKVPVSEVQSKNRRVELRIIEL